MTFKYQSVDFVRKIRKVTLFIRRIVVLAVIAAVPTTSKSQTLFSDKINVDITRYTRVEACYVGVERTQLQEVIKLRIFKDTIDWEPGEAYRPFFSPAIAFAKSCVARWANVSAAPADSIFDDLLRLTLIANKDDEARALAKWKIATTAVDDSSRIQILSRIVNIYEKAPPVRWDVIEWLMSETNAFQGDATAASWKVLVLGKAYSMARGMNDKARMEIFAKSIHQLHEVMPNEARGDRVFEVIYQVLKDEEKDKLRQTLTQSSEDYLEMLRLLRSNAAGVSTINHPYLGNKAPPIQGEFWFSSDPVNAMNIDSAVSSTGNPQTIVRELGNKISLVVYLTQNCRNDLVPALRVRGFIPAGSECWMAYHKLRAFKQMVPDLNIVIFTQTIGMVGAGSALELASDEARVLKEWWLDYHKIPATLAVTKSEFVKLPPPDRRRITNLPSENAVNYHFNLVGSFPSPSLKGGTMYLIDQNGVVVHFLEEGFAKIDRTLWNEMEELLKALVARKKSSS